MPTSEDIRARLAHPVIDGDGHVIEFEPILHDYIRDVAGADALRRLRARYHDALTAWARASPQDRIRKRMVRGPWGLQSRNVEDLATVMAPRRLYRRLDEFGIDYMLLYPSMALAYARLADADDTAIVCRAINRYQADLFREFSDRIAIAAIIPTQTPEQGIAELDHAIGELGLKVATIACANARPIPALAEQYRNAPPHLARRMTYLDFYGLDSPHDYDPLWRAFIDHKVAVTAHQAGFWGTRASISSYSYNHMGLFASANDGFCKSLFMSGVTRRFPALRIGLLEGGVGWGCTLFADIVEHWQKRSQAVHGLYDPAHLDSAELVSLLGRYGGERFATRFSGPAEQTVPEVLRDMFIMSGWLYYDERDIDEWQAAGAHSVEQIRSRFADRFFFGCEADDPAVVWALSGQTNPQRTPLAAFLGSDIGHWDVTDPAQVLAEAYEPVADGLMTDEHFRRFAFANVARLHGECNPDFFAGTIVESAASAVLKTTDP